MDKTELTRLKELAEMATHGEWEVAIFDGTSIIRSKESTGSVRVVAVHINGQNNREYISAANPATILAMIAEIEQLQNENQYLKDWAQIDIDASKASQSFEDELVSILGIDPDTPEKAKRSEILKRICTLQPRKWACDECGEVEAERLQNSEANLQRLLARINTADGSMGSKFYNSAYELTEADIEDALGKFDSLLDYIARLSMSVARLEKEADWLATRLEERDIADHYERRIELQEMQDKTDWREAARKAVEAQK